MKVREKLKLFIILLHTILIFLLAFITSTDFLSFDVFAQSDEGDEWFYEEDPDIGELFMNPPDPSTYSITSDDYEETVEKYSHSEVEAERKLIFENTQNYATASLDQMLYHAALIQSKFEKFTWMNEDTRRNVLTYVDTELRYFSEEKDKIGAITDADSIRAEFKSVRERWLNFRAGARRQIEESVASFVNTSCEFVIAEKYTASIDTDEKTEKFTLFDAACEDWGRDEDVEISKSLLEFIKSLK